MTTTGGRIEQITTGERQILALTVDQGMTRMVYTVGRFDAPSEIYLKLAADYVHLGRPMNFYTIIAAAQRRNEVSRMRWCDLDRRENWWNIPAELTKTKRPYRVPLTPAMLAIIEEMEKLALSFTSLKEYVTPQQLADLVAFVASPRGKTISGQALSVCGDTNMLA